MRTDPKAIEAVEEWFRFNFPGHEVASRELGDGEVVLFRAELDEPHAPSYELEITYLAFQDSQSPDDIVKDLNDQKAAERLRDEPTVRLMYNSSCVLVKTDRHSSRR